MALTKGDDGGAPATEFGEEWTCLNCHNGNVASVDMTPYFDQTVKVSEHPVMLTTLGAPSYAISQGFKGPCGQSCQGGPGKP